MKDFTEIFEELFSISVQFSRSVVQLFVTPWIAACQAYLSITNSQSLVKLMSIVSVMPSSHLILCHPLLLLLSIFPSIRVFSSESALRIRWPKYWSFSFNISPSSEHCTSWYPNSLKVLASSVLPMDNQDGSPLGWTVWLCLQSMGLSRVFSNTTVQKINSSALSFLYSPTLTFIHGHWKNHSLD